MPDLDEIFTKSNLDENKKKSKMLLGRLLIALRKSSYIKLYTLLESVNDTNLNNGTLILALSDKVSFDMINNQRDISVLEEVLGTIESGICIKLECDGKEPFDKFKFERLLQDEFGGILTIIREEK